MKKAKTGFFFSPCQSTSNAVKNRSNSHQKTLNLHIRYPHSKIQHCSSKLLRKKIT